jgi:valyl-tRNA synthetase
MIQSSINLDVKRVIGYRQFCNKLWNINKFALSNFTEGFEPEKKGVEGLKLSLSDKWILTRLSSLISSTNTRFDEYDFGYMVQGLYDFWLKELADYYIEALKPVMKSGDAEAKKAALNTLHICLDSGLRMLHPTMPYITEELFQRLPGKGRPESICIAAFPNTGVTFEKENVEQSIASLQLVVSKFRSQFNALNIAKNANPSIFIKCASDALKDTFSKETAVFQSLIRAGETTVLGKDAADPEGCIKNFVNDEITIYVKVVGLIDMNMEIQRVQKRIAEIQKLKDGLAKKTQMPGYEKKVPEKVRTENAAKMAGYDTEIKECEKSIADLAKFA